MEPVDNLNEKINRLQKQIDKIQHECKHKNQDLQFVKGKELMWVCSKCKKALKWPTQKETERFFDK